MTIRFDTPQKAYDYLYGSFDYERAKRSRYVTGQVFDLRRVDELDRRLDRPSRGFASIHVAGTKGKGSTCHMIASVLQQAGLKVGMFTSPHLVDVEERIRINGRKISPQEFSRRISDISETVESMKSLRPQDAPTFFEMLTVCAFLHFVRHQVDVGIVEVGLGGRLDSTNIIDPLVSVITEIGIDHKIELGDTIDRITREKCGIIKPGVPVVTSNTQTEALQIIRETAARCRAPLTESQQAYHTCLIDFDDHRTHFHVEAPRMDITLPVIGRHQVRNALCTLGVCDVLNKVHGFKIQPGDIQTGLAGTNLQGRFSLLEPRGRDEPPIIIDVAHNPLSIETTLDTYGRCMGDRKYILLFGASSDKDFTEMLRLLAPMAEMIVLTRAWSIRSAAAESIAEAARSLGIDPVVTENTTEGYPKALELAGRKGAPLLVTGTFYLVGEVMRLHQGKPANPMSK